MSEEIRVQKTLFDLASFDDVLLVKVGQFEPVSDVKDALVRLNGDTAALNKVINDGLKARAMQDLRSTADGWHTFKTDAEGELTDEINGPFDGQVADSKKVGNLVLSLAKSVFGFTKSMSKDEKRAAKEQAMEMVKSTPAIRNGLAKTAALSTEE